MDAAEALGAGACVTVVVLDSSGSLLASRKAHTSVDSGGDGSGSGSSQGSSSVSAECRQAFMPALRACNGTADFSQGSQCCGGMASVGDECLRQVAEDFADKNATLAGSL